MNILIIGAGTIGSSIAELLSRQGHNITIIDSNPDKLRDVGERLDVRTLPGSAGSSVLLQQAGVEQADLMLAMTNIDEVNLVSARIAKALGAKQTIARVRKPEFLEEMSIDIPEEIGIDMVISPEQLTALEILQFLHDPDALQFGQFAQDQAQLRRITLAEDSPFANKKVKDLKLPHGLLLVLVSHEDDIRIPRGDTELRPGDRVTFLGLVDEIRRATDIFGEERTSGVKKVCMAGGGETGQYLADFLLKQGYKVKLIDSNRERCQELSDHLPAAIEIVVGDVSNRYFLEEERINQADVFIAVTGDEETNIMSSLLAKQLGVPKCITKVNRPDYTDIVENVGIDKALSPRLITAEDILQLIMGGSTKALSLMEEGRVEVMELEVPEKAPIINQPLKNLVLPKECLVGMIVRKGKVKLPRGEDQIWPGDSVVIITRTEVVDKVEEFFTPRK